MLDPPNEVSPARRLYCVRTVFLPPSPLPLHTGPSLTPRCKFVHGPPRGFLVSLQFIRTRNFQLLRSDQAAFHHSHLITFSRPADGRPSHSGPWLTSSYSHRLDGRRCQYCNPRTRLFLSFLQNRYKLVSLPQEAADHVQIPLFAVPERFVHRALWPVPSSFPVGSRSAGANRAHFKRVTCSRWRNRRSRQ
jgi:hypothetical protein